MRYSAPGYRLLGQPLGGGFGTVFKAVRVGVEKTFYAIKFAKDPTNSEHVKRLRREADLLAQASAHPNVVKLIEAHLAGPTPYIILEYMDGGSLQQAINTKTLDYNGALYMIYCVAGALADIHRREQFHRDIKPDNILLDSNGEFRLSDFGLAGDPAADSFTQLPYGTPGYIDPTLEGRPYDWTSDIYSLGTTLAVCLTRRKPATLRVGTSVSVKNQVLITSDENQIDAMTALIAATTRAQWNARPSAALVKQYVEVCLDGGELPPLQLPKAGPNRKTPTPPTGVGMPPLAVGLAAFAVLGVGALLLGAAFAAAEPEAPPKPDKPKVKRSP